MNDKFEMVAKTLQGLEGVLADELKALGAEEVTEGCRMVSFVGDKEMMYRANFCCRTALRILKPFLKFKANSADELYEQVKQYDWEQVLDVDKTFIIDSITFGEEFRHSRFVTYRVKDAIADFFSERYNKRPSIRLTNPDIRFDVHIAGTEVILSLDSSGEPLYRRGWRVAQTDAPINEVLAAGIIKLSGWNGDSNFVDPMCGSGTFLIEAAMIAANINPGVFRKEYAFQLWNDYDPDLFAQIYNDDSGEREFNYKIYGSDIEGKAIAISRENIKNAGLGRYIELERRALEDITEAPEKGVLITNPPYGERLEVEDIEGLYRTIGEKLKQVFRGYHAWVICYDKDLYDRIGLKPSVRYPIQNGGLDCELREYVIFDGSYDDLRRRGESIKNEDFRASEGKRRAPRRDQEDGERPPRREFHPRRDQEDGERPPRREFRPRRDQEDGERPPRREFRPRRDQEDGERPPRREFRPRRDQEDGERPPRREFRPRRDQEDGERPPRREFRPRRDQE
ncbi:MAG: RNA methyltransferase, partial [Muribaculaceae bacterium]|nr:RNA methyltransferase [Muribaculaceae bacterium]